jgi:hypothetical protein
MSKPQKNIKELHLFGFSGILDILKIKGTFKKFPFYLSIFLSLTIVIFIAFNYSIKLYDFVEETSKLLLSFFPNLLGFSLGGYALVVGFSNTDLIKKGSETKKHSLYQILNAIFSLSIIFQVFTTILCFSIVWFVDVASKHINLINVELFSSIINALLLFMLLFGSFYSLFLTPYVITNLFTLSQLNNLHLTIENLKDENDKSEPSSD